MRAHERPRSRQRHIVGRRHCFHVPNRHLHSTVPRLARSGQDYFARDPAAVPAGETRRQDPARVERTAEAVSTDLRYDMTRCHTQSPVTHCISAPARLDGPAGAQRQSHYPRARRVRQEARRVFREERWRQARRPPARRAAAAGEAARARRRRSDGGRARQRAGQSDRAHEARRDSALALRRRDDAGIGGAPHRVP